MKGSTKMRESNSLFFEDENESTTLTIWRNPYVN